MLCLLDPFIDAFYQEYTPFLEQYFEYNAFPSARDRELLARKSSMTPRQIEVWVSCALCASPFSN